jgi:hypothetical protein
LRIASSSFSWPPPMVRYHRYLPLLIYQMTVPRCVPLASSLFLCNMTIYFGQFVRLRPFSMPNADLFCSSCGFLFLTSFLLFIRETVLRTCLLCKRGGIRILLASLRCSTVLAVLSLPRPPLFAFYSSCNPVSPTPALHFYLNF